MNKQKRLYISGRNILCTDVMARGGTQDFHVHEDGPVAPALCQIVCCKS